MCFGSSEHLPVPASSSVPMASYHHYPVILLQWLVEAERECECSCYCLQLQLTFHFLHTATATATATAITAVTATDVVYLETAGLSRQQLIAHVTVMGGRGYFPHCLEKNLQTNERYRYHTYAYVCTCTYIYHPKRSKTVT